jgi:uncharacterized protein YcbX
MPTLTELHIYPIKSCRGIALQEATVTTAGLMSGPVHDREWMVVNAQGESLTQREYPVMATIVPRITADALEVQAPGMPHLAVPLALPNPEHAPTLSVRVWNDEAPLKAYDCDDATAAWFSRALGIACRLVRFHPHAYRGINNRWTDGIDAATLFSDGYPMLVISEASLADLNEKLLAQESAALPMNRFRPNLVIGGIEAFDEDYAAAIKIGHATLRAVKPCPRCAIPSINQASGIVGPSPLDVLQTYRTNPKVNGGVTFGMNAILLNGEDVLLRTGADVEIELAF